MFRVKVLILAMVTALVLAVGALLPFGGDLGGGSANAEPLPQVLIRHNTSSDTNPFVFICFDGNAVDAHVAEHGDTVVQSPCELD